MARYVSLLSRSLFLSLSPVIFAVLILTGCADLDVAKSAYKKGDYETAARQWEELADRGFPQAQFYLAKLYVKGTGVEKDADKAYILFKLSSEDEKLKGKAFFEMARMRESGNGAAKNGPAAERYYKAALDAGYIKAAYNLAQLYHKGELVDKNIKAAIALYEQSSETGYARAVFQLGIIYSDSGNDKKAVQQYKKAYHDGYKKAAIRLARMTGRDEYGLNGKIRALAWYYLARNTEDKTLKKIAQLEEKLTPDMIAEAVRLTRSPQFIAVK